jgi:hypothetical protein
MDINPDDSKLASFFKPASQDPFLGRFNFAVPQGSKEELDLIREAIIAADKRAQAARTLNEIGNHIK